MQVNCTGNLIMCEESDAAMAENLTAALENLLAAGELSTYAEALEFDNRYRGCPENIRSGLEQRYRAAFLPLLEHLAADHDRAAAAEKEVAGLAEAMEGLCGNEDWNSVRKAREDLDARFSALGAVAGAAALRYRRASDAVGRKLQAYYRNLNCARWASYKAKLDWCRQVEDLGKTPDSELGGVAGKLREMRARWKTLGQVPHERLEEINQRYLEVTRRLQERIDTFFTARRRVFRDAAERKQRLVAEAEALAGSSDIRSAAAGYRGLQEQWRIIPASGQDRELYAGFRAAGDRIFNALRSGTDCSSASAVKLDLIERARRLDASSPEDIRAAKSLRSEFMRTGYAGESDSDLRRRFDAVMESFFSAARRISASGSVKNHSGGGYPPAADLAEYDRFSRALAGLSVRMRAGESIGDNIADLNLPARFTGLVIAAGLLSAEDSAGLDRHSAAADRVHLRCCEALENATGTDTAVPAVPGDLAPELTAAIIGNFCRPSPAVRNSGAADPRRIFDDWLTSGLGGADLDEHLKRFTAAAGRVR